MPSTSQPRGGPGPSSSAAGMSLRRMHRTVRVGRTAVWAAVASGPVALAIALMPAPVVLPASKPVPQATAQAVQDPSGYAELFVSSWLRSNAQQEESAQSRRARALAPDVALPEPAATAQLRLEGVRAVRSVEHGHMWVVTVAAQYTNADVRYLAVEVSSGAGGGEFTVAGSPAVVAGPAAGMASQSRFRISVPSGPLASTAAEFLRAYLTGAGAVERYLAPGTSLRGLGTGAFTSVEVQEVMAADEAAAASKVPSDRTRVRIEVSVVARAEDGGRWPLAYAMTLAARDGRWEIASMDSGAGSTAGGAR